MSDNKTIQAPTKICANEKCCKVFAKKPRVTEVRWKTARYCSIKCYRSVMNRFRKANRKLNPLYNVFDRYDPDIV